jgi:hypothetical protein
MTYSRTNLRGALALALAAVLAFAGIAGYAQEVSGSISGTVTDSSGAIVKGASVVFTATDRNQVVRSVTTNSFGFYTATSLPIGVYSVSITAPKFSTAVVTHLILHANDALTVSQSLHAGNATESVVVTAEQVQINLENATTQSLVNGTQVRELVLNNRNYEQLVALQPGVVYGGTTDQLYIGNSLPSGTTNTLAFSINGHRASTNDWTIDGADNLDRGSNLTAINYPSVDAIAEFKTLRGTYSAAYGRTASSQINVVTRSGTNDLHGSVYEFFRNDVFNANGYFNNLNKVARPELRYHDFGGTVGGPVVIPHLYDGHDKTFFFFSEEIRRVVNATGVTSYEPLPSEIGLTTPGVYSFADPVCTSATTASTTCPGATGNTVTPSSATALAYIKDIFSKLPAPNAVGTQDPHTLVYNAKSYYNNEQELVRIDHKINAKASVFYRFVHDSLPTKEPSGLFNAAGTGLPGVNSTSTTSPGTTHMGHLTYVLSPRTLFDFGYAYTSGAILSTPSGLNSRANSPDINPALPYANTLGIVPVLTFQNGTSITGPGIYNDYSKNHNIFGSMTRTWHTHTITIGASINHYEKNENATTGNAGTFNFNGTNAPTGSANKVLIEQSIANFLQGVANNGFSQTNVAATPDITELQEEGFIQDDWRASRRLTLNIGVRYSHFLQPVDNNGQMSSFLPSSYVATNATTVDPAGYLCTYAETTGITSGNTKCPILVNGLVPTTPTYYTATTSNSANDWLNGIILGNYTLANQHYSTYGAQVAHTDKLDFAPRFGLAYDVFGDGRTSFRAGYGIAFDDALVGMYEQNIFANPPYVATATLASANLDTQSTGNTSAYVPPTLQATPADYHPPYSQQYSMSVQHQFNHDLLVDVAFVGSHDTHLLGRMDINEVQPGAAAAAGLVPSGGFISSSQEMVLNQVRPYKGYSAINTVQSGFNSNYNSLQVQGQKRFKRNSLIDVNYTWSRAMTNAQADRSGAVQNAYYMVPEYGRSQYDRKHVFTTDFVYALPWFYEQESLVGKVLGGWELSGIVAVNSGLPYTATVSSWDPAGLGFLGTSVVSGRPNQIGNPNIAAPSTDFHNHNMWFNTAAFAKSAVCTLASSPSTPCFPGNEHQDSINGPGFERVDLGAFRNFKVTSRVNFQFRAEAFNLFNHVNWATIGTSLSTSSTFGKVQSSRDPRILQIALKASF